MRRAIASVPGPWPWAAMVAMLLVAPPPAGATQPITELPRARVDSLPLPDLDHLPSPAQATRIAARNTMVPIAVGGGIFALGLAAPGETGGAMVLGTLIGGGGILLGPVSGYVYGGVPTRGALGVALRLGLIAATPVVFAEQPGAQGEDVGLAVVIGFLAGLGLATLSDVWDISVVGAHVEQHNRRLRQESQRGTSVRIESCRTPGVHAPGVAVRIGFGTPAN